MEVSGSANLRECLCSFFSCFLTALCLGAGVAVAVLTWRFAGILVLLIKNYIWEAFKRNILMINPIYIPLP